MKEITCRKCNAAESDIIIDVGNDDQFIFQCRVCEDVIDMGIGERAFYGLITNLLDRDVESLKSIPKKKLLEEFGEWVNIQKETCDEKLRI